MTLSIEIKKDALLSLFKHVGEGDNASLVPFLFPGQRIQLPSDDHARVYLTRVPVAENTEGLVAVDGAREDLPAGEIIGMGFDGYIVESSVEKSGGKVNGMTMDAGASIEDEGIVFIAT